MQCQRVAASGLEFACTKRASGQAGLELPFLRRRPTYRASHFPLGSVARMTCMIAKFCFAFGFGVSASPKLWDKCNQISTFAKVLTF